MLQLKLSENNAQAEVVSNILTYSFYFHNNNTTTTITLQQLRLLLPYIWPTQSVMLQFKVVLCLLILVAGRVVNPYVPIYSKKISEFHL